MAPASSKVTVLDSPGWMVPVSNIPAAVAVCCWESLLVHVTVPPTATLMSAATNLKSLMSTVTAIGASPPAVAAVVAVAARRRGRRRHRHRRCRLQPSWQPHRCELSSSPPHAVAISDDGQSGEGGADDHTRCSARPPSWIEVCVSWRVGASGASPRPRGAGARRPARGAVDDRRHALRRAAVLDGGAQPGDRRRLVAEPAGGAGDRRRQQRLRRAGVRARRRTSPPRGAGRRGRAGWSARTRSTGRRSAAAGGARRAAGAARRRRAAAARAPAGSAGACPCATMRAALASSPSRSAAAARRRRSTRRGRSRSSNSICSCISSRKPRNTTSPR